jgi:hypothetical protein
LYRRDAPIDGSADPAQAGTALTGALDWDELATQVYGEDVVTDWQCELAHEPANDD